MKCLSQSQILQQYYIPIGAIIKHDLSLSLFDHVSGAGNESAPTLY